MSKSKYVCGSLFDFALAHDYVRYVNKSGIMMMGSQSTAKTLLAPRSMCPNLCGTTNCCDFNCCKVRRTRHWDKTRTLFILLRTGDETTIIVGENSFNDLVSNFDGPTKSTME